MHGKLSTGIFAAAAAHILLAAGCATGDLDTAGRGQPAAVSSAPTSAPAPRFVPYIPGFSTNREIRWLTPKNVMEDYTVPEKECRQKFVITGDDDMVWHLDFAADVPSFGAIVFRRTNDLAAIRSNAMFRLRVKPASAAPHLRGALLDGLGRVVQAGLAAPDPKAGTEWELVEFPLTTFAPADGDAPSATFDWSAVREFRLIANGRIADHVQVGVLRIWKENTP